MSSAVSDISDHKQPNLLDQVRSAIRLGHYGIPMMDQPAYPVPQQTPSQRDWKQGNQRVSIPCSLPVREDKGEKYRITMLPTWVIERRCHVGETVLQRALNEAGYDARTVQELLRYQDCQDEHGLHTGAQQKWHGSTEPCRQTRIRWYVPYRS